jgi:hypothetical protein
MATNPATQEPDSPRSEHGSSTIVRRELLIFGVAVAFGLILIPFFIWLIGNRILGPYTHTQDPGAGTGPLRLIADFFTGLAHGSAVFWCVALGPYVLVSAMRVLYGFVRPSSPRHGRAPGL